MRYKLLPNHPAHQAFEKMCDSITACNGNILITGGDPVLFRYDGVDYHVEDLEGDYPIEELPPRWEYKLTYSR